MNRFFKVKSLSLHQTGVFTHLLFWKEKGDLKRALKDIECLISEWEGEHEEANKPTS